MKFARIPLAAACAAIALSQAALAGSDIYFTPLTASATVTAANSTEELESPWVAPAGITSNNLTSMREIEADIAQSIVRVPGLGSSAAMFDMIAYDPSGRYIFIPHETFVGAGASRYDTETDTSVVLFRGNSAGLQGDWSSDWGAFDPSTWTPNGTLLVAEEWSGLGRVLEITNPLADPAAEEIEVRELESIANVSHEGLRFSSNGREIYFVDEDNSGSIYKLVLKNKHDLAGGGQTSVLVVKRFAGDPAATWNSAANAGQPRTGAAFWVPITDKHGNPLTETNPFDNNNTPATRPGRLAADEVNGTPFGRPEDIEIGHLADGREVLYVATTSENSVYSIVLNGSRKASVNVLVSDAGTPKNAGFAPTTGLLNSPDNLAQDAAGNIYVIEDAPNSSTTGGDVWFARDVDGDGVAESLDHFLSLRVAGSEATGMIFNPANPDRFAIAVQHPNSTDLSNVPEGFGDAIWTFDISSIAPR